MSALPPKPQSRSPVDLTQDHAWGANRRRRFRPRICGGPPSRKTGEGCTSDRKDPGPDTKTDTTVVLPLSGAELKATSRRAARLCGTGRWRVGRRARLMSTTTRSGGAALGRSWRGPRHRGVLGDSRVLHRCAALPLFPQTTRKQIQLCLSRTQDFSIGSCSPRLDRGRPLAGVCFFPVEPAYDPLGVGWGQEFRADMTTTSVTMTESKSPPVGSNRRGRWAAAGAVLLVALMMSVLALRPRRLEPGECLSDPGVYRSPGGRYRITISAPANGFKSISLTRRRRHFGIWYETVASDTKLVDQERDWFHCFDQYDRLWSYEGPWNKAWGPTRRRPGGGHSQHAPSVILDGAMYIQGRGPMRASSVVSTVGNWAGIPKPFLDRIPDKDSQVWGDIPSIPAVPPEYTAAEDLAIRQCMSSR